MKHLKYFFQFFFIIFLLILFKIIGLKLSRIIASKLFLMFGSLFRSKIIIEKNISYAFPSADQKFKKVIMKKMWESYGKILAEYMFIKHFRETATDVYQLAAHAAHLLEA